MVVSAPGKRTNKDKKVTDLLIQFYNAVVYKNETEELIREIVARYTEIAAVFHVDDDIEKNSVLNFVNYKRNTTKRTLMH